MRWLRSVTVFGTANRHSCETSEAPHARENPGPCYAFWVIGISRTAGLVWGADDAEGGHTSSNRGDDKSSALRTSRPRPIPSDRKSPCAGVRISIPGRCTSVQNVGLFAGGPASLLLTVGCRLARPGCRRSLVRHRQRPWAGRA